MGQLIPANLAGPLINVPAPSFGGVSASPPTPELGQLSTPLPPANLQGPTATPVEPPKVDVISDKLEDYIAALQMERDQTKDKAQKKDIDKKIADTKKQIQRERDYEKRSLHLRIWRRRWLLQSNPDLTPQDKINIEAAIKRDSERMDALSNRGKNAKRN